MSTLKKLMTSAMALSLVAVPVAAQAADASKLSLSSQVRAGKATKGDRQMEDGGWIVAALAAAAVIAGIVIIADGDDDPDSP